MVEKKNDEHKNCSCDRPRAGATSMPSTSEIHVDTLKTREHINQIQCALSSFTPHVDYRLHVAHTQSIFVFSMCSSYSDTPWSTTTEKSREEAKTCISVSSIERTTMVQCQFYFTFQSRRKKENI